MIKLIIFDGEGVLYSAKGVLYSAKKVMKVFEKEYEKFLKKFGSNLEYQEKLWLELYPKIVVGKISLREANKLIYKKTRIPTSKVDEWLKKDKEIWLKNVKLNKNVKKTLLKIKAKGIKIAILSDTVHPLKWRLETYKKFGLVKGKHYDKIFLSNLIGYEKPRPKAYLSVLYYFKIKPEEAIFVGHGRKEIEGAKKLGIKIVSFDSLFKKLKDLN